jgi:hypothetical protein
VVVSGLPIHADLSRSWLMKITVVFGCLGSRGGCNSLDDLGMCDVGWRQEPVAAEVRGDVAGTSGRAAGFALKQRWLLG